MPSYGCPNHVEQQKNLFCVAVGEIQDQNGVTLMLHKVQPIVEQFAGGHASIFSTTP